MTDLIDTPKVTAWLDAALPQLGDGPLTARLLTGGATNAVFKIDRGGKPAVLRRPPAALRPDSEKILAREARVLNALNGTDVPRPEFYAACEDRAVNGSQFYVMEFVEGWVALDGEPNPPAFQSHEQRRKLPFELVSGIARLSNVDYRAVGLEGFGKPENFLARQVDRWLGQLASYKEFEDYEGRPLPGLDVIVGWLRANIPQDGRIGVIHGDYGFANAMFALDAPAKLVAMVDWELSTIGDPLLDLGWLMYARPSEDGEIPVPDISQADDAYPLREELVDHYAQLSGRPVRHLTYYMVLAQFKLLSLLERFYARSLNGKAPAEKGEYFGRLVLDLLRSASAMVERDNRERGIRT